MIIGINNEKSDVIKVGDNIGSYKKKAVISGGVVEIYNYSSEVVYGYKDKKKRSCGRRSKAQGEDKEINREKVLSRARRDLRRLINSNIQQYSKFMTLTFKDNIQDLTVANYEFTKFMKRLSYHYKVKIQYSVVIEFQDRGAIHYHCLLYNLTEKVDVNFISGLWGNGFVKMNAINNVDNVGAYVCKYMTKTDDDRLLGRKMYFNSRGLKKPLELKEAHLVDAVESSLLGQAPKYESTFTNEYNSINYSQYIIKIK